MTDERAILRDFAVREARGHSPLYERLALAGADRPAVYGLLAAAPVDQRRATLLFATIGFLARRGGEPFPRDGSALESFCARHADAIADLLRTRRTQTNEPARSAQLLPAISLAAAGGPIALLEVGASAGLNLVLDRYRYELGGQALGPLDASVVLAPVVSGRALPDLALPRIAARIGLDLAPIHLDDADERDWLKACVWADQRPRLDRLDAAIEVVMRAPPPIRAGDARTDLGRVASELPADLRLVIVHSNTLAYLDADGRQAVRAQITAISRDRAVAWVSAEGPGVLPDVFPEPPPLRTPGAWGLLGLATVDRGQVSAQTLAIVGPHGAWLEWL